jgi:predicted GIY-YIG superfamily endonuclease
MITERKTNDDVIENDKNNIESPSSSPCEDKKYYVYILESSDKAATYVGATINLDHRLRQHNKELAGGAHATSVKVAQGSSWHRVCHVSGFPDWSAALQFEWRLKQLSRKICKTHSQLHLKPIDRRIQALHQLLALERPTSKAKAFSEWNTPPKIVWENM